MLRPRMDPARNSASRRWLLLAALAACAGYLAVELRTLSGGLGFPLDDSWIHLQFARNLAAGRGLSYNPGELVTGSTAPLWTALLSLLFYLPGSAILWAQLLGAALYIAGVDATWRLGKEMGLGSGLNTLAAGLTLGTSWLVWSALSGMEVPLFVLLSLWGMILHSRERRAERAAERPALSLGVFGVATLARPEGLLLLLLALADRCLLWERAESGDDQGGVGGRGGQGGPGGPGGQRRWRRPPLTALLAGALLAACVLAGPLLFYRLAGGSFLPTTWSAKGGGLRHWLPNLQYVAAVLRIFVPVQPYMTLFCGAGALALIERLGTRRDRGLLPALWVIGLPLAYSTLSPEGPKLLAGNFGRYYFPLFPPLVLLGTLGIERAAALLAPPAPRPPLSPVGSRRALPPLRALLALLLLLWPTASSLVQEAKHYAHNLSDVEASDIRVARWLAPRLPPEAVLAVNDIGALKYLLPNRVIDLAGIANPELRREVARALSTGTPWSQAMLAAIARRRPDYVIIFPAWIPGLAADPRFRPVFTLHLPDNQTMGSPDLAVYSTPWTRFPLRTE